MTSKVSFFNITKQDTKRRIWVIAIILLGFIMVLPISGLIRLEMLTQQLSEGTLKIAAAKEQMQYWIGPYNSITSLWVVVSAVLCGFTSFAYIHSRQQLDLFHSLPMKRRKLFFSQYLSGLLGFVLPFIVCSILTLILCLARGLFDTQLLVAWGQGILNYCLYFLVFYQVTILAMMLTGKLLVSILGMLVFWSYTPLLILLFRSYAAISFETYYELPMGTRGVVRVLEYLSPLTLCFNQKYRMVKHPGTIGVLVMLVVVVVLLAVNISLYQKRPSEAAGKSMAFAKVESPIKVFLLIPLAMASGLVLRSISYSQSNLWLFVGVVLGLLIFQGIIEVIYHYDVRKIGAHKVSLAVATIIALLIVVSYRVDLFSYDNYLPKENQIVSAAVSIDDLHAEIDYVAFDENNNYSYQGADKYRLTHMKLADASVVLEIAQQGIASQNSEANKLSQVVVKYKLKNNQEKYRCYQLPIKELTPQLNYLYGQMEYKQAVFPIMMAETQQFNRVAIEGIGKDKELLSLSDEKIEEFVETYKRELSQLTYEKIQQQQAIGSISFYNERINGQQTETGFETYPLYSFFDETIKLLAREGVTMRTEIVPAEVDNIEVTYYGDPTVELTNDQPVTQIYRDEKEIKEILDSLIVEYNSDKYYDMEDYWSVEVTMKNQADKEERAYLNFREGEVPDFVKEKL